MTSKKQTSCADPYESDAISVDEAKKRIFAEIDPLKGSEKLALRSCLNRFLAEDINSPIDVPPHANSAMDGYAIAADDLPTSTKKAYQVSATAFAGKPTQESYKSGQLIRIMTGAVMPKGTDTVIMQEMTEKNNDNTITIKAEHKAGQNVRRPGEDIEKGSQILSVGKQITAADLGILASLGIGELRVFRKPRVAFFSTGDELRSIGDIRGAELKEGEIYDSNRYTLFGMLKNLQVDIIDMGVIGDTQEAIREAFVSASEMADIVITSGGVSVGEADYIKPTLKKLGNTHFWKIAMKPGRPLTFGTLASIDNNDNDSNPSWFFGLPGNPVAVMVTFMQFVQPAIQYLASGHVHSPITLQALCTDNIYKRSGRSEFQRGIFKQTTDGKLTVRRTGKQGSGILTSMSLANCFIYLPSESEGINEEEMVEIIPFSGSI
ncbi:MAG: gephyrin-like molybdotransferase Glp [Cocleimonas sp.]